MAGETRPPRDQAGHAGLLGNLLALAGALAGLFESRAALFATESRRTFIRLTLIAACLVEAAMFFAFGYVFLIVALVFGISATFHVSWILIAIIAAALHFLFGVILIFIAEMRMRKPFFRETLEELRKDREWLKSLEETTPN